jgi:hypothetical protein
LLPANPEEKTLAPLADKDSLANGQLLTCGSKIAGLVPIGHQLGRYSFDAPEVNFSNVSLLVNCSGNVTINASRVAGSEFSHSHTFYRLSVQVTWPNRKRKREESDIEGYQTGKTIGE